MKPTEGRTGPALTQVDTLIRNARIVTMDSERRVFTDGFLAVQNGRIVGVGRQVDCAFTGADTLDARGMIVLPGFANAHNHLVQNSFRGYNDDRWPVLDIPAAVGALVGQLFTMAARMDAERTYRLVRLHALEMLKLGYTATHDEHFTNVRTDSVEGSWQAIADSGMRGYLCRCVVDSDRVPPSGRESIETGERELERLAAKFSSDRIRVAGGFLNYTFVDDPDRMRRIRRACDQLGIGFDVDMTDNSRGAALRARGFDGGQVEYYRSLGLLDGPLYAGKAVSVRPEEYPILLEHDCRTALVPALRFFDATGIEVDEFLRRGVLPAIGTDAPLVSDSQNPFEVMRMLILAQNLSVKQRLSQGGSRPAAEHWLTAETCLEMATLGGARTLFMDDVAGSIEIGRAADIIVVDTDRVLAQPDHDGRRDLGALVWGGQTGQVDTVFVNGTKLLAGGRSTVWDEEVVLREAQAALREIAEETELDHLLPDRSAGRTFRGWTYL